MYLWIRKYYHLTNPVTNIKWSFLQCPFNIDLSSNPFPEGFSTHVRGVRRRIEPRHAIRERIPRHRELGERRRHELARSRKAREADTLGRLHAVERRPSRPWTGVERRRRPRTRGNDAPHWR